MAKTVIGVFKTQDNAEAAVNELHILGYDTKYISLLMKDLRKVSAIKSKGGQVISGAARDAATGAVAGGLQGILIALGIQSLVFRVPSAQTAAVVASVLVDLANEDRATENLATLSVNPVLEKAAQMKADDMASYPNFSKFFILIT